MQYETIIGLEVHIQLATEQKAFCTCATKFGAAPNTQTCAFCLGQGKALPELNRQAVELALKAALALNCQVPTQAGFDRKHYSALDLPKGYQITQWRAPFGKQGYLDVEVAGQIERVPLKQVHLEEDAGRAVQTASGEIIDFNRAGIPLIEIVTPPVFRTATAARAYLEALQLLMRYLGVSDARIEEGSMRCELNISLRPVGSDELGEMCEIKNIGSLRGVVGAIAYEEQRQAALLDCGSLVPRETRRWDEVQQATFPMRSKEQAIDYRYSPEPDLPTIVIDNARLDDIKRNLPELPLARQQRYQTELKLSSYAAREIIGDPALAAYFEAVLLYYPEPEDVANWLLTDLRAQLNQSSGSFADCPVAAQDLADLLKLVRQGTLSHNIAKQLLTESFASGQAPAAIARSRQLQQVNDREQLQQWVEQVIEANAAVVAEYQGGKERAFGFLMGQLMHISGGLANPLLAKQVLYEILGK